MIELYISATCPFCQKVERAARELGLIEGKDYKLIDARPNTPGRDVVLKTGGRAMVPFMIDGGTSMYESDDIITYLKNRFDK